MKQLTKLANHFLQVLASEGSAFIIEIVTVDPKMQRLAMLSFMHQLQLSPYRTMIKYVQDRRNDSSMFIAFKEPVSKETVLKMCNSLPLSFSRHDDDKFFEGGGEELIVVDIDVESYLVHPVKEALSFTIVTSSPEDALAIADELKRFARIKDAQAQDNVVQVTFKDSSSVNELRAMCEKLSRLYLKINKIDIDNLLFKEASAKPESKELLEAALKANKGHGIQVYFKGQHFGWYKWNPKKKHHEQFSIGDYSPKDTIGELEEDLSKCPRVNLEDFMPVIAGRKQI